MTQKLARRQLLRLWASSLASPLVASLTSSARAGRAPADEAPFDILDLKLEGSRELTRRALVAVPRELPPGLRIPVLVLLHGLGETTDETAGVRAWVDRYGLLTSHGRLARPPVLARTRRGDLPADHAREINDALATRPFDGKIVYVCPFTPNVWQKPNTRKALDKLSNWMTDVLLPEVRSKTPAATEAARTGIDGCSLGGFIGLEVFLRLPEVFGAWGGVQSAFGEAAAPTTAQRIAEALKQVGPRPLHIETSLGDPFYRANLALSRELKRRGIAHDFLALPGPHDQPWLREAGTLEMLLWHDRALSGSGS